MEQMTFDFEGPALTDEERIVWGVILDHRGKGHEIKGQTIAARIGMEYTTVRATIAHLVNVHHKLIGSNGRGYYVPVTPAEIAEVTKSLRHRGIMILVRAARLQKTSLVEIFHQASLEFQRDGETNG
jgi:predicted transcriptional regulator